MSLPVAALYLFAILPRVTDRNRHFWTGGEAGELRFLRCQDCGFYIHPPLPLCPTSATVSFGPSAREWTCLPRSIRTPR